MIQALIPSIVVLASAQSQSLVSQVDVSLGTLGLTTRTAQFDPNLLRFFQDGSYRTPLYDSIFGNPWHTPRMVENFRQDLTALATQPHETITVGSRMIGVSCRRGLVGNPNATEFTFAEKEGALEAMIEDYKKRGWVTEATPSLDSVPDSVKNSAAVLMAVAVRSLDFRKVALASLGESSGAYKFLSSREVDGQFGSAFMDRHDLRSKVDLRMLMAGGFDLVWAAQEASVRASQTPATTTYNVTIPTKLGDIVLTGGSKSAHGSRPVFLIIDTGGDDQYTMAPCNRSSANPLSVVIDTEGKDLYISDPELSQIDLATWPKRKQNDRVPGPGGALLGYSVLIDRAGDDIYRSHRSSMGSAQCGVAYVNDLAGNDIYDGYANSQGFAQFGLAVLEDEMGDDRYLGFNQVQGVGLTMGAGLLIDRGGSDKYHCNDSILDFPSAQTAEHNISMSQGAGCGRRADYLDGHNLAGGVGALFDFDGNDQYIGGVFAQGVGYWMGVGYLYDATGNDAYAAQWYAQGASAHFAVGVLEDGGGNDTYTAPLNMAMGAGHDFSVGLLLEGNGDDIYSAPNLSLGAGNASGIGWCLDMSGKDSYTSSGITLGSAADSPTSVLRSKALCLGLFMDLGGDDTYPPSASWAKNAARTPNIKVKGDIPSEGQAGVFWDR